MQVVLASGSPRRQELLKYIFPEFQVIPAVGEEKRLPGESPEQLVCRLALEKAQEVWDRLTQSQTENYSQQGDAGQAIYRKDEGLLVIGGDTVVALEGEVFGKPSDPQDAARMLEKLSDKTHQVYSGTAVIYKGHREVFCSCSQVTFYPLDHREIQRYISTGEPMGKAGAYAIQGQGMMLVKEISGSYPGIVGLPVAHLKRKLEDMGIDL